MKIRTKLLLLLTVGALVPLALSHFFAVKTTSGSMVELVTDGLAARTEALSGRLNDKLSIMVEEIKLLVESTPFESFESDDLSKALSVPYRQMPTATAVALLDENGRALARPYTPKPEEASFLGRETVTREDLELFAKGIPMDKALEADVAFGPVYPNSKAQPRMVVAMSFPVAGGDKRWILAIEHSLKSICEAVTGIDRLSEKSAILIDQNGFSICEKRTSRDDWRPLSTEMLSAIEGVPSDSVAKWQRHGEETLAAASKVQLTGWIVVQDQPRRIAMAPVAKSLNMAAIWIALSIVIAIIGGIILARGITKPLAELEDAATRIAAGEYDAKLELASKDEVGKLAESFNKMKNEIRLWNDELNERVELRTKALKLAQEQILFNQKAAAVGELGAGVAHEINNPLTAMLGNIQLLQMKTLPRDDSYQTLETIVSNGRRVAEIVQTLLRFTQTRSNTGKETCDLVTIVAESLSMFQVRFEEGGIDVKTTYDSKCIVQGVRSDLGLIFHHLLDNAYKAMPKGGLLEASVRKVEGGAVEIVIRDNGIGMPPDVRLRAMDPFFTTSSPGSGSKGLGLPMAYRMVEQHNGRIIIESEEGEGTKVTIYLPAAVNLSKA